MALYNLTGYGQLNASKSSCGLCGVWGWPPPLIEILSKIRGPEIYLISFISNLFSLHTIVLESHSLKNPTFKGRIEGGYHEGRGNLRIILSIILPETLGIELQI